MPGPRPPPPQPSAWEAGGCLRHRGGRSGPGLLCKPQLLWGIPRSAPGSALLWSLQFLESSVAPRSQESRGLEEASRCHTSPGWSRLWPGLGGGPLSSGVAAGLRRPPQRGSRPRPTWKSFCGSLAQAGPPSPVTGKREPCWPLSLLCHLWRAGAGWGLLEKPPHLHPVGLGRLVPRRRGMASGFCG